MRLKMNNNWHLTNQMNYLYQKNLIKGTFKLIVKAGSMNIVLFVLKKMIIPTLAYSTEDRYHWICPECFDDFKTMFEWRIIEDN